MTLSGQSFLPGAQPVAKTQLHYLLLYYLQELLDKGCSPFTLKDYVAAIAVSHALMFGQSVGQNNLVVHFQRGFRRLNLPWPPVVPAWDLPISATTVCRLENPFVEKRSATGFSIG